MAGKRQNKLNDNVFHNMTPEVAYWLGFITADGCIRKSKYSYFLKILLSEKDISHLEKIKKFTESSNVIWNGGNNGKGIQFTSKIMYNDLLKWGIEPRKTYSENDFLTPIPKKYRDYFIIGLLDGDGSIVKPKVGGMRFKFLSNLKTLKSIVKHLNEFHNISIKEPKISTKKSIIYHCTWSNNKDILKFYKIYKKSPIKLYRKFNRIKNYVKNKMLMEETQ